MSSNELFRAVNSIVYLRGQKALASSPGAAMPVLGETISTLEIPFGFVESTEE